MRRIFLFFSCGLLLLFSCSRQSVIRETKMEAVLYDLHLADGLINKVAQDGSPESDSIKNSIYATVFNKHKITKARFDTSMVWYANNVDKYVRIYNRLSSRFSEEYNLYEELAKKEAERLDTFERWTLTPQLLFTNQNFPMIVHFNDTLSTAGRGDTLSLSFSVFGVATEMRHLPRVQFSLHYPDTTDTQRLTVESDSLYKLTLPVLSGKTPDSLSGYFFVRPHHNDFYRVLFNDISLTQVGRPK